MKDQGDTPVPMSPGGRDAGASILLVRAPMLDVVPISAGLLLAGAGAGFLRKVYGGLQGLRRGEADPIAGLAILLVWGLGSALAILRNRTLPAPAERVPGPVTALFYLGVLIQGLLGYLGVAGLSGAPPDAPGAPWPARLLLAAVLLATVGFWFLDISGLGSGRNRGGESGKGASGFRKGAVDTLGLIYGILAVSTVWNGLILAGMKPFPLEEMGFRGVSVLLLMGIAYVMLCLPAFRYEYLDLVPSGGHVSPGRRGILYLFMVSGTLLALSPLVKP